MSPEETAVIGFYLTAPTIGLALTALGVGLAVGIILDRRGKLVTTLAAILALIGFALVTTLWWN